MGHEDGRELGGVQVRCPACDRGAIGADRTCDRCKVALPIRYDEWPVEHRKGRGPAREQETPMVNYVRTKEDK